MKTQLLSAAAMLVFAFTTNAQTESSNPQVTRDDSLVVQVPESIGADLSLITPPEGFVPTDKFNGYIHLEASSGIILTLIDNANYIKISEGMTDEFFRKNNLTFIEKQSFESDNGVKGIYYKCSFLTGETPFIRYIVYAGDLNRTLWLNITYPTKLEELIESEILKTIQTIQINATKND